MSLELDIKKDVDNYEQTIGALLSISQHFKYEHNAESCFGRKFRTSNGNKVQINTDVTPDLSTKISDTYGVITEAKKNFARQDDYDEGVTQAKKYDDNLKGWDTSSGFITNHDIVLLTHTLRGVHLEDCLTSRRAEFDPSRRVIIVEFTRNDEVNASFILRRRDSKFTDNAIDEKFRQGFSVNLMYLLPLGFSETKFYDAAPPVAYTLQIIWDNVLSEIPTEEEYRKAAGRRKIEIEVTTEDLCEKLRQFAPKQNGERLPEIPKKEWVEIAMKTLVEIKLAKYVRDKQKRIISGRYIVFYKKFKSGNGSSDVFIPKIAENQRQQRLA